MTERPAVEINQSEKERRLAEAREAIEKLRRDGLLNNDAAQLATAALDLSGDDALLANRLVSRGSDPGSLQLVVEGKISEPIMRAHRQGPGCLNEDEKWEWLELAAKSLDENADAGLSVGAKVKQFMEAADWLKRATPQEKRQAAEEQLKTILALPYEDGEVRGVRMRIYESDAGFASAYWSGEEFAAVKEGDLTFVGSKGKALADVGVKVDKQLSPTFGIIFPEK